MVSRKTIDDFLQGKRIAVVGVSRKSDDFSRLLYRDLKRFGYDVVPVNTETEEIEGTPCCGRVQDLPAPVDGVLLMTKPEVTDKVVRDCAEAGVKRIWMYRGAGRGAVSEAAVDYCVANGMEVVPGGCPYMFLSESSWIHHLHGFLLKITGRYPR